MEGLEVIEPPFDRVHFCGVIQSVVGGAGLHPVVHDILDGLEAGNPDFEVLLLLSHGSFLQLVGGSNLTGQGRRGLWGVQFGKLGVKVGSVSQFLVCLAGGLLQGQGLLGVLVTGGNLFCGVLLYGQVKRGKKLLSEDA